MARPRLTLDQLEYVNAASQSRQKMVNDLLAKAAWIAGDGAKDRRLAARECKGCHYSSRISGQAFTQWRCKFCGTEDMHSNTGTPWLCNACSDAFGLCATCGGDIDMRHRTRRFGRLGKAAKP